MTDDDTQPDMGIISAAEAKDDPKERFRSAIARHNDAVDAMGAAIRTDDVGETFAAATVAFTSWLAAAAAAKCARQQSTFVTCEFSSMLCVLRTTRRAFVQLARRARGRFRALAEERKLGQLADGLELADEASSVTAEIR